MILFLSNCFCKSFFSTSLFKNKKSIKLEKVSTTVTESSQHIKLHQIKMKIVSGGGVSAANSQKKHQVNINNVETTRMTL